MPRKHVTLELGGNAAAVVCDGLATDLDWAATRIATFSNYQAGQSCIAVQRVYRRTTGTTTRSCDRLVAAVEAQRDRRPVATTPPTSAR